MATDGRGGIHSRRKSAFSGHASVQENRIDTANTNKGNVDVDWSAVGPSQYPEIHAQMGNGESGGPSGGFVLGSDRPD